MSASRNTVQKQAIWQALLQCGHPTAEEVYSRAGEAFPNLSRGTVYRVLNQMAAKQSIARIPLPQGADRFDHNTEPHHHFCCSCCKRIFDLPPQQIRIKLPTFPGGRITGYSILFEGVCSACEARSEVVSDREILYHI